MGLNFFAEVVGTYSNKCQSEGCQICVQCDLGSAAAVALVEDRLFFMGNCCFKAHGELDGGVTAGNETGNGNTDAANRRGGRGANRAAAEAGKASKNCVPHASA